MRSSAAILLAIAPAVQSFAVLGSNLLKQTSSVSLNREKTTSLQAVDNSRRHFLGNVATFSSAFTLAGILPKQAAATTNEKETEVYFGAGCFWHIQHELLAAERELLSRSAAQSSSRVGYAGGTQTDKQGRLCYHNLSGIADYGKLGHGEVVGVNIPEDKIGDFAKYFFSLLGPNGERADPMDKGGEYRSLIGLPGGQSHPRYNSVLQAATAANLSLKPGVGNEPDTLGKRLIYVYDSNEFPFHQAEVYHQYHNDFLSAPYGKDYNDLANAAFKDGRLKVTGCPDRV